MKPEFKGADDRLGADDLGVDDLGVDDLGADDLGVDDLGADDLGVDDLGVDDLGVDDLSVDDRLGLDGEMGVLGVVPQSGPTKFACNSFYEAPPSSIRRN